MASAVGAKNVMLKRAQRPKYEATVTRIFKLKNDDMMFALVYVDPKILFAVSASKEFGAN